MTVAVVIGAGTGIGREIALRLGAEGATVVLACNSGVGGPSKPLVEVTPEECEDAFSVNVTGVFLACRAFLPTMTAAGAGSVVVIGSITGKRPLAHRTPYAASKMALVGLVRTLAVETGPSGVRVNLVSPGAVEGPRLDWVVARRAETDGITEDEARAAFTSASPLGRLVTARDVAETVAWLTSPRSGGTTGEDVNVAAGAVMY